MFQGHLAGSQENSLGFSQHPATTALLTALEALEIGESSPWGVLVGMCFVLGSPEKNTTWLDGSQPLLKRFFLRIHFQGRQPPAWSLSKRVGAQEAKRRVSGIGGLGCALKWGKPRKLHPDPFRGYQPTCDSKPQTTPRQALGLMASRPWLRSTRGLDVALLSCKSCAQDLMYVEHSGAATGSQGQVWDIFNKKGPRNRQLNTHEITSHSKQRTSSRYGSPWGLGDLAADTQTYIYIYMMCMLGFASPGGRSKWMFLFCRPS